MNKVLNGAYLTTVALAAGLLFWTGAAAADELSATDDLLADSVFGAAVSANDLDGERAKAGIAYATVDATQNVNNTIDSGGGSVANTGGAVNFSPSAIDNARMTITAINTGNNVVMNNQLLINLYFD